MINFFESTTKKFNLSDSLIMNKVKTSWSKVNILDKSFFIKLFECLE